MLFFVYAGIIFKTNISTSYLVGLGCGPVTVTVVTKNEFEWHCQFTNAFGWWCCIDFKGELDWDVFASNACRKTHMNQMFSRVRIDVSPIDSWYTTWWCQNMIAEWYSVACIKTAAKKFGESEFVVGPRSGRLALRMISNAWCNLSLWDSWLGPSVIKLFLPHGCCGKWRDIWKVTILLEGRIFHWIMSMGRRVAGLILRYVLVITSVP